MNVETLSVQNDTQIEALHKRAVTNLDAYLKSEKESVLRTDQVDVMHSLHDFLASGKTSGYISLPPGSGKTVLASEMTAALKPRKAVLLSPTHTILRQTGERFEEFSPETNISDFYSRKKDLTGDVINTTYPSFIKMLDEGLISPDEIDLIFCDESHMALGEERHKIWRRVPNAIKIGLTASAYFGSLDGYQKRGIVDPTEEWVGLFREKIHSMSIEEAMEKGILAPLEAHLVRTRLKVDDVSVLSTGDYNRGQLEKALNVHARNYMTLAMVAGLDAVPPSVHFDTDQNKEIAEINEKIQGKKTAIFGLSIEHVEELAQMLRQKGISAEAYHSKLDHKKRDHVLKNYKEGTTQIILGVDALRVGWDSPETEVGMYLAPTQSGVVAVQELGRILRPSPETGKEVAIAIQFVDQFVQRDRSPVIITDIFDPECVLRGSGLGEEKSGKIYSRNNAGAPKLIFSGMDIKTLIRESKVNDLLRGRFKDADLVEISQAIGEVISDIKSANGDISSFQLYKQIAQSIPRIPAIRQQEAIQSVASLDSNLAKKGAEVVVFTSMATIISAAERYFGQDEEENSEILSSALLSVYDKITNLKIGEKLISQAIYVSAQKGAADYIASREGMTPSWANDNIAYTEIEKIIEDIAADGEPISADKLEDFCESLAAKTSLNAADIESYIKGKLGYYRKTEFISEEDAIISDVVQKILKKSVKSALLGVTARERKVLELRYGLVDGKERTLREVGEELGVTGSRIGDIERTAFDKMKRGISSGVYELRDLHETAIVPPTYPAREKTESRHLSLSQLREIRKRKTKPHKAVVELSEKLQVAAIVEKTLWQEWLDANYSGIMPERYDVAYSKYAIYRDKVLMEGGKLWPESWKQRLLNDLKESQLQVRLVPSVEVEEKKSESKKELVEYGDRKIEVTSNLSLEDYLKSLDEKGREILLEVYTARKGNRVDGIMVGQANSKPMKVFSDGEFVEVHGFHREMKFEDPSYLAWYGGKVEESGRQPDNYVPTNYYLQTAVKRAELGKMIKRLKLKNVGLQVMRGYNF